MKELKAIYTKIGIGPLCMLFGKTRHAFYDRTWYEELRMESSHIVLEMVAQIRREIPRIGTPKLYYMLKKSLQMHGIKMGRDSLHNLLLEHGLTIKPKRRYIKTTDSNHWMKKYTNRIKQLTVTESEQLWVSDITYIQIKDEFNFLSLITDVYSKQIMGHCLYPSLEAQGPLTALKIALAKRQKRHNRLIHHSDRGTQYCSGAYVELLQENNIEISMTENGDPYENAVAERINGILKGDFDLGRRFESSQEADLMIEKSIGNYNVIRPHMSCDNLTPAEAHQMTGLLKKKWKPKIYSRKTEAIT